MYWTIRVLGGRVLGGNTVCRKNHECKKFERKIVENIRIEVFVHRFFFVKKDFVILQ